MCNATRVQQFEMDLATTVITGVDNDLIYVGAPIGLLSTKYPFFLGKGLDGVARVYADVQVGQSMVINTTGGDIKGSDIQVVKIDGDASSFIRLFWPRPKPTTK